jgi:hypothetical protein
MAVLEVSAMSEKQELIRRMLELQKQFMAYEHAHGVDPKDYYTPDSGHPLENFRTEYQDLAMRVVDLAHQQVGSKR